MDTALNATDLGLSVHLPKDESEQNDRSVQGSEHEVTANVDMEAAPTASDSKEKLQKELVGGANNAVFMSRIVLFSVLVITAALVGTGVYLFTKQGQQSAFEKQFSGYADRVLQSFATGVERKLGALDALSVTITSFARSTNSTFPNVTLPDFVFRGANSRILADTLHIWWTPLVTDETKAGWEAYTQEDSQLAYQQEAIQEEINEWEDANYDLPPIDPAYLMVDNATSPEIWPNSSGPYLPVWQTSPVIPWMLMIKYNPLVHPDAKPGLDRLLQSKLAVIDLYANLAVNTDNTVSVQNTIALSGQYRHSWDFYHGSPLSPTAYPVFDSLSAWKNRTMVGALQTNYFTNILPATKDSHVMVILQNSHNQTFSYQVNGPTVVELGVGDYHHSKYDHMGQHIDLSSYIRGQASPSTRASTTVDLDSDYCAYSLVVYPTQQMEDEYVNNKPMTYMLVVLAIFLFTSLAFVLYDYLVERRQRAVLTKAIQSGNIVSSLFPENVRKRLYEEQQNAQVGKRDAFKVFLNREKGIGGTMHQPVVTGSAPIADYFDCATVLFADIAGFTTWSSSRQPSQVFVLLETIYQAFDSLALRRRVFKIETIGDCYVAVTGVPEAQGDHALIMCRFAFDCITKLNEVTADLADTLGADTKALAIRVGIHSGAVTAGVLRGQKGRFQLFGDTVNTASRMESTGMPGRIHVSSSTAAELSSRGKSSWLLPRGELVDVKGKGRMQTFWVEVRSKNQTSTTSGQTPTIEAVDDAHYATDRITHGPKTTAVDNESNRGLVTTTGQDANCTMEEVNHNDPTADFVYKSIYDVDGTDYDGNLESLMKHSVLRLTNGKNQRPNDS